MLLLSLVGCLCVFSRQHQRVNLLDWRVTRAHWTLEETVRAFCRKCKSPLSALSPMSHEDRMMTSPSMLGCFSLSPFCPQTQNLGCSCFHFSMPSHVVPLSAAHSPLAGMLQVHEGPGPSELSPENTHSVLSGIAFLWAQLSLPWFPKLDLLIPELLREGAALGPVSSSSPDFYIRPL